VSTNLVKVLVSCFVLILVLSFSQSGIPVANAGLTGSISGKVFDADGNPVKGANVAIFLQNGESPVRDDETSKKGKYRMVQLNAGLYRVEVSLDGYETAKQNYVQVSINGRIKLDFFLNKETEKTS